MRLVIQRVKSAVVKIDYKIFARIAQGILVFIGFRKGDEKNFGSETSKVINRLINLRVFEDQAGKVNLSLQEVGGEILLIPNFTLYGDFKGQNRPSFTKAMGFDQAEELYDKFLAELKLKYQKVQAGVFGAMMEVEVVVDGPVTLLWEN